MRSGGVQPRHSLRGTSKLYKQAGKTRVGQSVSNIINRITCELKHEHHVKAPAPCLHWYETSDLRLAQWIIISQPGNELLHHHDMHSHLAFTALL